ncbi:hypothetical protein EDB81DRAFT_650217 [Dactylonectria macrodidyma]|uniref:Peroxin/Ferlin domain-containing protein n=1 Tax=Dactylonectria macrodidyma TaxID=307937 RepID=A0A9P9J7P2_9HYPO|nr:hypothetical protein EDB81DRAFT_650217 [Dactylonectria macrodidyma]
MLRVTSSRRAAGLKPTDFDHEISLVDHDAVRTPPPGTATPEPAEIVRSTTTTRLLDVDEDEDEEDRDEASPKPDETRTEDGDEARPAKPQAQNGVGQSSSASRPSIEIQQPTPNVSRENDHQIKPKKREERESVIDILYENERGGFLCGIALFSGQALGGLDPAPWTNAYHNTSPTNIHTAQVPDPSWEWTWPDWRINHQEGVDEGGWEYAFAFSKKFSWHRARWWNSFVRRRAWTRKRAKRQIDEVSTDPHMLNADYFTVRSTSDRQHHSRDSVASSRHASRASVSQLSAAEAEEELPDIENIEDLMRTLRQSRIDREKLEATENYLEHAVDLSQLQDEMHEIMAIFVFQASRRILLSRLMQIYDDTTAQLKKEETDELRARNEAIKDAVKHADEEVRKLAYWSDVKQMAENGEVKNAVDGDKGWNEEWRGLDRSGGAHPKAGEVPNQSLTTLRFESTSTPTPTPFDFAFPTSTSITLPLHQELSLQVGDAPPSPLSLVSQPVIDEPPESKNRIFRDAFKLQAHVLGDEEKKKHYPVTGHPRTYPNHLAGKENLDEHSRDMRRQVGHSIIWDRFNKKVPSWKDCFETLRRTTPEWSDRTEMSAVRIILPKSWSIEVNNLNLEYVDSATGVLQRLRASVDKNPSAVILRGKSSILSQAIDDIVRSCKEAEVYELGEVATSDYKTKRLWPTIEGAPNGGASIPEGQDGRIWMHKESRSYELQEPYENIPRPEVWTQECFKAYIATLCYGRVPAHLAIKFYGERRTHGRNIDTDGIRIRLIVGAFEDTASPSIITAPALRMAVSMMAFKGGHRASANKLVQMGEELGIPMDTDTYNLMLEGYAHKRDLGFFYAFLRKMEARYIKPNVRTWLLFLQLIRGDDERRQIVLAMYELGMLNHPTTRKGIADVMAPTDAYTAFKAGQSLDDFLVDQAGRYGKDWLTPGAVSSIITELLRFHRAEDPRIEDCKRLIDIQIQAGHPVETQTVNIFVKHASATNDWNTALWATSLFQSTGCEPNQDTYAFLITLAIKTRSPHALGTIYFYGVLNRKLKKTSRQMLSQILLRLHRDPFWQRRECQPTIFPKDVIASLEKNKIRTSRSMMSRIERVILDKWEGYTPIKPLARSLELAIQSNDKPLRQQVRNPKRDGDGAVQPIRVKDLVTKLRPLDGEPGNINVRLKGRFDPRTMIEGWDGKEGLPSLEEVQLMAQKRSTHDVSTKSNIAASASVR